MSELDPTFEVRVWFDGDDDAEIQTANFRAALIGLCSTLGQMGYCRAFEVRETRPATTRLKRLPK